MGSGTGTLGGSYGGGVTEGKGRVTGRRSAKPIYTINKSIGYSAASADLLLDISKSVDASGVKSTDITEVRVKNEGDIPAFAMFQYKFWTDATTTTDDAPNDYLVHYLLAPNQEIRIPATRAIIGDGGVESYLGTAISSTAPNALMFADSDANLAAAVDSPDTSITVTDGDYFRVGDLIQLGVDESTTTKKEIMEVTAIAGAVLTVKRGLYGSNTNDKDAQTDATEGAVSGANVYLPFFNAHHDYDKYSVAQTDAQGRFKATNFFGEGRAATALQGIVPGSFAVQFYEGGSQSLDLSDISSNTNTGLTASTAYEFDIQVDGGTNFDNFSFTTDSSDLTFAGSSNAVLPKIQSALDTQYYTSGNLFEKRVTVGLQGGDVVFRSASRLSTSAIALTAGSSGTAEFFGTGRIPAVASIASPIGARLSAEQSYDPITYSASYNDIFLKDNGYGRLFSNGLGGGSINYETGAINMVGCPANAEFVFSVIHTSAFSGKLDATETLKENSLKAVYGNITSQKGTGQLKITTY